MRIALACAAGLLAGCTTVHVHSEAGVERRSSFGVAHIHFPPDTAVLTTQVSGAGMVMGAGRFTLGWMSESAVALRDASRCQVVFVSATPAEARAIRDVLGAAGRRADQLCFLARGESQ
jgi:hypothetical protein